MSEQDTPEGEKPEKSKGGRPKGDSWYIRQPECVQLIMTGITEMRSGASLGREISETYDITFAAGLKRVDSVWKRLAEEAGIDRKVDRQKVSHALLDIYREARNDMDLANCLKLLKRLPKDERSRILAKWDPYKGAALALKALEQYTKLRGLNSPELLEVKDTTETLDPLTMTPKQRKQRITELMLKGKLNGPLGAPPVASEPEPEPDLTN